MVLTQSSVSPKLLPMGKHVDDLTAFSSRDGMHGSE